MVDFQIMNADTGAPLPGVRIKLFRQEDGRAVGQLVTDKNGAAGMRLGYDVYRYVVTKPGFQQIEGSESVEPRQDGAAVGIWLMNLMLTPELTR